MTATTSDLEVGEFRRNWISKFEEQAGFYRTGQRQTSSWEGFLAYRELKEKDNLWLVLPNHETDVWPFDNLTKQLCREIRSYKLVRNIPAINRRFKKALEAFSAAESELRNANAQENPEIDSAVNDKLDEYVAILEKARSTLKQRRESFWQDFLLAEPEEKAKWSVWMDDAKQVHLIPPANLAAWEEIYAKARYPRRLTKRIDLDSRFQIRVAVTLRHYLLPDFQISRRTISRLTVLTYVCGNLVDDLVEDEKSIVKGGKRNITVGLIEQKLQGAGLK
jgi:hypothetical protein